MPTYVLPHCNPLIPVTASWVPSVPVHASTFLCLMAVGQTVALCDAGRVLASWWHVNHCTHGLALLPTQASAGTAPTLLQECVMFSTCLCLGDERWPDTARCKIKTSGRPRGSNLQCPLIRAN